MDASKVGLWLKNAECFVRCFKLSQILSLSLRRSLIILFPEIPDLQVS